MSHYSLIIIDVQPDFLQDMPEDRGKLVLKSCQHLIKKAKKQEAPILFVEFLDFKKTHSDLTNLVKRYSNMGHLIKSQMDGSVCINRWIRHYDLPRYLKICGIFTDQCVFFTAESLRNLGHDLEIVEPACGAQSEHDHDYGLDKFKNRNIKINYNLD